MWRGLFPFRKIPADSSKTPGKTDANGKKHKKHSGFAKLIVLVRPKMSLISSVPAAV
jgi:hypothetical protein